MSGAIKILDQYGREINRPQASFVRSGSRQYQYAAADYTRERQDIGDWSSDSKNTLSSYVRRKLMSGGRYLFENVGMVRGAILDKASYSVGNAFIPTPSIEDQGLQRAYMDYFMEWAKSPDVTGRCNFTGLLKLVSIAIDRDGDLGCMFVETPTGYPKLRLVESHNIGNKLGDQDAYDGVLVDRLNRARAYRVFTEMNKTRDFSSFNMILVYEPDRADELRGKSSLAHAINDLLDRQEILDAEKFAVKIGSKLALVLHTDVPADTPFFGEQTETQSGASNLTFEKVMNGAIPRLMPGEELKSFEHNRPSNTFSGFLEDLIRNVSLGLRMPFEFIWDASKLNGTGNRVILEKVDRSIQERQATLVRFSNRVWSYVCGRAFVRGDLPEASGWNRVTWQMPKKLSIDPGRDGRQALEEIKFGTKSAESYAAECGRDIETIERQKYEESLRLVNYAETLSKQTGKSFDFCFGLIRQMTPNGNVGMMTQPQITRTA